METLLDIDIDGLVFEPPDLDCVLSLPGLPGGGSKLHDGSSYGGHGAITGATWSRLPSGLWCLDYDGSDDYVNCGSRASLNFTTGLTMEVWIKPDGLQNSSASPLYRYQSWGLRMSNTNNIWLIIWLTDTSYTSGVLNVSADAWHHVVGTYDKSTGDAIVYVDGAGGTAGATSRNDIKADGGQNLLVGSNNLEANRYFNGLINLARIYNRALSALEIQNHFDQEKHLFGVW